MIDISLGLLIALIPFINITKGIDFTDTGYSVVNFLHAWDHEAYWSLSTFFANVVGWILMMLPFGKTYLGIKIYTTLIISITGVGSYFLMKKYLNRFAAALGVALSLFVIWCPSVVLYNQLTYLLDVGLIALIMKGLFEEKKSLLFVSGLFSGLDVFVRFSNLTRLIFIIPVICFCIYKCESEGIKGSFGRIFICIGGFASGVIASVMTIGISHGFDSIPRFLSDLRTLQGADYGYSFSDMILTLPEAIVKYGKWFIGLVIVSMVVFGTALRTGKETIEKKKSIIKIFAAGIVAVLTLIPLRFMSYWGVFTHVDYTRYDTIEVFVGYLILMAVFFVDVNIFSKNVNAEMKIFSIFVLCLIFIIPLGTNTGMQAYQGSLFIIAPFVTGSMVEIINKSIERKSYMSFAAVAIASIMLLITVFQFTCFRMNYIYGDVNNRELTATYERQESTLNGVKMLPGMVGIIEGLEEYFEGNVPISDEVITWGNIPLMSFALKRESAISTGWPDLTSYSEETFKTELEHIADGIKTKNEKPVVIVNAWFSGGDPLDRNVWEVSTKAEIMGRFIIDNDYELVYENDKFKVYR
ncbi:MAG: hypothetical protein K6D96_06965 [Acetatifactor sp.]|nr:hypothetical protein [Acetatifactor sp.]